MTGSALSVVRTLLKAELGVTGTADDTLLNQAIVNKQFWFCSKWDWSELDDRWDVNVGGGSQYNAFPTADIQGQTATMRLDRPLDVEVLWNTVYLPLEYGITTDDYNIFNPAYNQYQDPIQKWYRVGTDKTKFEVWPVPVSAQTVRFTGQRTPIAFSNPPADADKVDLDDLMLALFVAADWLKAKGKPGWDLKAGAARDLFLELRANDPTSKQSFTIGRDTEGTEKRRIVPLKVITVH